MYDLPKAILVVLHASDDDEIELIGHFWHGYALDASRRHG